MSALLHLVGFAPEKSERLALLRWACSPGDTLVLLDAGRGFAAPDALDELQRACPGSRVRLLGEARESSESDTELEFIDTSDLVELTETHRGPASWY